MLVRKLNVASANYAENCIEKKKNKQTNRRRSTNEI